ncbi:MAG: FecR family protein [Oligoflexia bacterium]|nr:FecR family protein [Oligoflexia bacterium]
MNATGAKGHGASLAVVERREAKVRRKLSSSYVWTQVQQREPLYRRDSLQTGPDSAAAVRFTDGSVLEVGEESLIIIDDIKDLSLNFVRGSAIVRKATGDARITAGKDGKAKVEELPVQLLSPEHLATVYTPGATPKDLAFTWRVRQEKAAGAKHVLQLSPDKSFSPRRTQSLSPESADAQELTAQLAPGRYFWRVVSETGGAPAVVRELRIVSANPLRLVWPGQGKKVMTWTQEATVPFRWMAPEARAEGEHWLELSRDPAFGTLLASEGVRAETSGASLAKISEGTLYWRIRSRFGDVNVTSPAETFAVERSARIPIELAFPPDKSSFELQPRTRFGWSTESSEALYRLEVQDAATQQLVTTFQGHAGSFSWDKPAAGSYRWRVSALMDNHVAGESAWRAFALYQGKPLALKAPSNLQEFRYWEEAPAFELKWGTDSLGAQEQNAYQVDISQDPQFRTGVLSKKLKGTSIPSSELSLAPGDYSWRVRVVDAAGNPLKSSETFRFAFGPYPLLKPPAEAAIAGAEADTYNYFERKTDPVVSWAVVPEAAEYELVVYVPAKPARGVASGAGSAPSRILLQKTLIETSFELKGLKEGEYAWTVRAIDRLKRKGEPMPPRRLNLTYGQPLEAPEELSPEVQ